MSMMHFADLPSRRRHPLGAVFHRMLHFFHWKAEGGHSE
jgi:hypothetical protein